MLLELSVPWTWLLLAVAITVALQKTRARRKRVHLPPGPPPLPFIGNALDIPRKHLGLELQQLSKRYGTYR